MTKVELAKMVVGTVVSLGTGKIVKTIIDNNVTPVGTVSKVTVTVAALAISWIASDAIKKEAEKKIDELTTSFSSSETKYA